MGVLDMWLLPAVEHMGLFHVNAQNLQLFSFLRMLRLLSILRIIGIFLKTNLSNNEQPPFQLFVMGVIAFNSILMAFESDMDIFLWPWIEQVLLIIYTFDVPCRLRQNGLKYFLFFTINMTPKTNFIISYFWRWLMVHMWVKVTFEIFATVIVAYLFPEMGSVSKAKAERATYIAVMLFCLTAVNGVGHNFYRIAKPTGLIALGSVFSTTQVFPLILLTLDALKHMQIEELAEEGREKGKQQFVMGEIWLFLMGVNFCNVFGAGLMGSMINLPIINYYEHATFFTGGYAYGAMFGVLGNIALASILYGIQHTVAPEDWCPNLVRTASRSMNGGIALMMVFVSFICSMVLGLRLSVQRFDITSDLRNMQQQLSSTALGELALGPHAAD